MPAFVEQKKGASVIEINEEVLKKYIGMFICAEHAMLLPVYLNYSDFDGAEDFMRFLFNCGILIAIRASFGREKLVETKNEEYLHKVPLLCQL